MKTSTKVLAAICTALISLTANAQHRTRGNDVQVPTNTPEKNETQTYASNDRHRGNNWNGSISVHVGAYPGYGSGYGYNNYYGGNYYSIKKAARNSIRSAAQVIGNALQFTEWNDIYSPWLAKAIRHQQYARQLYFWGDYAGALNHAERAGFLAWNTLSYFNSGYGYNDPYNGGGYPNPYSDPNNPYYRQSNTTNDNGSMDNSTDDYGYRKKADNPGSETTKPTEMPFMKKTEIDNTLPASKLSDRELLKTSAKDLDIE